MINFWSDILLWKKKYKKTHIQCRERPLPIFIFKNKYVIILDWKENFIDYIQKCCKTVFVNVLL